jgi:hypothetical protein
MSGLDNSGSHFANITGVRKLFQTIGQPNGADAWTNASRRAEAEAHVAACCAEIRQICKNAEITLRERAKRDAPPLSPRRPRLPGEPPRSCEILAGWQDPHPLNDLPAQQLDNWPPDLEAFREFEHRFDLMLDALDALDEAAE